MRIKYIDIVCETKIKYLRKDYLKFYPQLPKISYSKPSDPKLFRLKRSKTGVVLIILQGRVTSFPCNWVYVMPRPKLNNG